MLTISLGLFVALPFSTRFMRHHFNVMLTCAPAQLPMGRRIKRSPLNGRYSIYLFVPKRSLSQGLTHIEHLTHTPSARSPLSVVVAVPLSLFSSLSLSVAISAAASLSRRAPLCPSKRQHNTKQITIGQQEQQMANKAIAACACLCLLWLGV